ncbi:MAG: rRNA pseudouridine synthase [Coriobacteriales bacterium]|nr:rRNA pseudouridine synthase [Coriobacteriales bacterium]
MQYPVRLQKYLAACGVASRRHAERLIAAGRVSLDGATILEHGTKVLGPAAEVKVDGRRVKPLSEPVYLLLNKPAGYLTTMADERGRASVADLVPLAAHPDIFPVGRLDKDTTGALLFTNDGNLGHDLLHPSHHVEKVYQVVVKGLFSKADRELMERGIVLRNGYQAAPAKVRILRPERTTSEVRITISEGKKRQIKMMCNAVHHPVLSLNRQSFGPLKLGDLPLGQWRYLSDSEVLALHRAV